MPVNDVSQVQELAVRLKKATQRVIVGKDKAINLTLIALLCRGHILLEDVPGIGKTTLSKVLAQSLGCVFKRIQFTPDLMPSDVLGVNFFNQKIGTFEFRKGPVFAQVLLADEINRATPRTQSALLEAMQERQATIDGETHPLPEPFVVIATQNPIEMEGTFPLPEAQVDRFMVNVSLGYPSSSEEEEILLRFEKDSLPPVVTSVTNQEEVANAQQLTASIKVEPNVRKYVVDIIRNTREHSELALGASPRAGLALYKASQATAAIDGRDFVTPDDVKSAAIPVLAHRLMLTSDARLRNHDTVDIVAQILSTVNVPIES